MNVIETNDPQRGAAYRVLYETVMPFNCATRARKAEIEAELTRINEWAATQGAQVAASYKWASDRMLNDIEKSLSANELGTRVNAAFAAIPKPPKSG